MGNSANSPEIYITRYLYDTWGRLQQMIYPDTEVLTYAYDSGGQPRAVEGVKLGARFPYMTRLEYDRFEQRAFMQLGNGIRSYYAYDPLSRRLDTLESGDFQRFKYGYDKVGNVTALLNDVPNAKPNEYGGRMQESFVYDDLYRLTSAAGTWFQPPGKQNRYTYALQYDDIHNIQTKDQQHWIQNHGGGKEIEQHKTTYSWSYDYGSSKPHAPTHIGDRTFFYDDNGNQTGWDDDRSGQRRTIIWDEEDRIRSISDNGRTTRFVYDDAGNRVIKTGAQGETVYVNDKWTVRNRSVGTKHVYVGSSRIASKLSPGDAHVRPDEHDLLTVMLGRWWEHRSTSGNDHGQNVDQNPHYQVPSQMPGDGMPDTNFLYFYHPDHIGSTSYVTDVDGQLYENVQYFPSGETWVDQRSNTERLPYLFSGKELDQETGLYYFGARYYDPRVGLWASTDPALHDYLDGSPNLGVYSPVNLSPFTYASNNPLRFTDPTGRFSMDWKAFGIGAVKGFVTGVAVGAVIAVAAPEIAVGAAVVGTVMLAKDGYEIVSGREILSGRHLSDSERSERLGQVVGGIAGGAVGFKAAGGRAPAEAPPKVAARGRPPGPTIDPRTGSEVGRFIVDPKGNTMIEPVGGKTVPAGKGGVDTHTLYPNGSNYQRLNPQGHGGNPTPHAHGHLPGTGPGMKGQGPSIDPQGNVVPWNSPQAHWPIQ